MPTFADQVDYRPAFLSLLQVLHRQVNQLRASQTAAEEHRQHQKVSLAPDRTSRRNAEKRFSLLRSKPVSEADLELFGSLPSNAGSKFRAEQTAISRFLCKATSCGQTDIYRG